MKASHLRAAIFILGISAVAPLIESGMYGAEPSAPGAGESQGRPIVLEPVGVSGRPVGSFAFSVRAIRNGMTQKALQVTVDRVLPNSEAEKKGVGPLTQILSIDGRDVQEFTASFAQGSDLNRKLMYRKPGERITLEILNLNSREPKFVTLTEGFQVFGPAHQDPDSGEVPPNAVHVNNSR